MEEKYTPTKLLLITLGFIFFILGAIGAFLPIMPTVPFLIISFCCFSKGSRKFHKWFVSTQLYKDHVKEFLEHRTLSLRKKLFSTVPLTISFIGVGILYKNFYLNSLFAIILIGVYSYIFLYIKTSRPKSKGVLKEF